MEKSENEVVEALRELNDPCDGCESGGCSNCSYKNYRKRAADLIESQQAQIDELTAKRDEARRDCAVAEKNHMDADFELSSVRQQLAESQRRESAAVEAIKTIVGGEMPCDLCAQACFDKGTHYLMSCHRFELRGQQEGSEG